MAEIIKTSIDIDINTSGAAAELRRLQQQINAFNLTLNKNQKMQGQAAKVWSESLADAVNRTGMFRAEVVKMQTSAAALDATLRKGQATLGQFFSAAFNKRSAMAAETFALAAERARTMQTQFIATGKSAKGMQDSLAIRPLTAFSSELSIASQRTQILSSMFRQGTTQLINFGKNVQWAGRQLMVGFTVPLTIFGTTAGRVFRELEMQAVSFKKVYGDIFTTPGEIQGNLEAVMQLGKEYTKYGIAVKDTVGLAAQAAAAGRRGAELTDAVRETTRLATLGQMDQNSALETTIALQSAFRLSGQQLSDTINFLNMVENQTVVSLQDIASAIPRVAPVIQGLGGDVKDLTVFLAAMQEGGVSAEQGANALKSGLGSLINPSKEATKQLGDFGINIKAIVQQNQGDLMGIVTAFSQALSTLGEFQQQQVLETLFGKYQYARLGALFENIVRDGSQAQQVIATMGYTTQQLAQTAEKELSTVEQAFSVQLIAAVERLKLAIAPIGELFTKMAIPIVNFLTKIVEAFNRLPEGTKNFVALATVITGLLIPAATMMFGLFANLIGTLAKMGQSMSMFGVTLLKRGPVAAIKSLTDSSKYLSLSEIDAANAARQLGSATGIANEALLQQIGAAKGASTAISSLTTSYERLIAQQIALSKTQSPLFGPGAVAGNIAKTRGVRRNKGGIIPGFNSGNIVPGSGNTDTVPAMLTPGEFVVNKQATKNNLGLLHAINAQKFNDGGVAKELVNKSKADNISYALFVKELQDKHNIKFAGQDKILEKKVSYEQLERLYNDFTEKGTNVSKIDELTTMVVEQAKRNTKEKNTLKSDHLKTIVRKTRIGNKDTYFKGLGKTHASHTTNPNVTTATSLYGLDFQKTGVPLQELGSRVIALEARINNKLSGKGVDGLVLLDEINTKGYKIFSYMDAQFEKYLELNQGKAGFDKNKVLNDYNNRKVEVFSDLTTQLSKLADSKITDYPGTNTISFESIFDKSMEKFDTRELQEFHKEIKRLTYIRAPRLEDLRDWAFKNPDMKAYLMNKKITQPMINSMKGDQIWDLIFDANDYAKTDPAVKTFSDSIFTINKEGEKNLSQPLRQKPGAFSPLSFKTSQVEEYVKAALAKKILRRNKGNIVPGMGNKDTVPAMLTPGEFVVNKQATQQNLGLLHAINSQKLNKGGKVKGMQYFLNGGEAQQVAEYKAKNPGATTPEAVRALGLQIGGTRPGGTMRGLAPSIVGSVAAMAAFQPLMDAGSKLGGTMTGLAASLVGTTAISGLLQMALKRMMGTPVKLAEQFSLTTKALTKVNPIFQRIGIAGTGWIGATIGLGVATYKVISTMNEIRNSGSKLTEAMYGGINSVNNMAVAFGRQTPTQQLTALKAQAAGGVIGQQAQQQANQFVGTDAGKQLIADIELAKKNGEDAATALKNQLARNILAGVITTEEARGVAVEIGNALNDEKLAVDTSAKLTKLLGPNGEEIKNNRLKIIAEIAPELNSAALIKQATEQYTQGTQGFWGRIGSFFDNKSVEITSNAIKNLATSVSNYALIQKQNMDNLELQMIQGTISVEEYNKEVELLDQNARQLNNIALKSFFEISGIKDAEKFNKLLKETQKVESRAGTGTVIVPTEAAAAAQKQVENQVKSMQEAYFAQIPNITEEQKNATISGMKAAFGGTESTDIILGWAQLLGGYISAETVKGLASGAAAAGGAMNKAGLDALKRSKATAGSVIPGTTPGTTLGGTGEDPLQRIKDQIKETDALLGVTQKLIDSGLRPEIAATLNAAEAKAILADKSGNLIKKLNEEADKNKVLSYIYKDPKQMGIEMYNKQIEFIDRGINAIERQISVIKRKNELDQRSIDVRNRALEQLSKQEKSINDQYNLRFEALDKVSKINDRITQQTQDRIALASALTSGDFAAAAQAAAGMTGNFAQAQIEDARSALELQRKQEVEALTVSVNGQLMTRQQIENEIDIIEERMYQRDQQTLVLQDQIYVKEEEKYLLQQEIQTLNDQIALKTAQQTVEMGKQVGIAESLRAKLQAQYNIARAIALRKWDEKFATGGEVKNFAYGGVAYRGSKEAPPALKMATGSIVPGMGLSDKVPALLTPGEFVVRKSVAQANMPLLKSLNGNVFPNMGSFGLAETAVATPNNVVSNISSPVYNYSVNVNVPNTTSSPNEIADVVISKIKMTQGREIRGNRY